VAIFLPLLNDQMQVLPIDDVLPALITVLRESRMAVVQAPPGAGKTTRVPLAIMQSGLVYGTILMLEPRRLATRAAAERMAQTLGEEVGDRIGYRMRGETKVSPKTQIEVVTDGILTRMIQSDPQLTGIGAVIFDEFHERSMNADFGLALALELRAALREDLVLVVMSATLDAEPVAALMGGAPMITSSGRAYCVETHYLSKALSPNSSFESAITASILEAYVKSIDLGGAILVFLPGEAEIHRVAAMLGAQNLKDVTIAPLYGAMTFGAQRQAIAPLSVGRKIILATSIAETSLTIPDVRAVVDGGRARRARFDPNSGMSRLVTEKVTRAEATQRKGRAGRVSKGLYFPLWTRGEEGALAGFPPAEIETADLTGLALELALWGGGDKMQFLTLPPIGALTEARTLLCSLGALEPVATGQR
jgi:ATP-dependent helicase HrpB